MRTKKQFKEHKDLHTCLQRMNRAGGQQKKAADSVHVIRSKISDGEREPFKGIQRTSRTGGTDNRIDHCVKYDLSGYARLITLQTNGLIVLRYAGSHDVVDKWLENNKGLTVTKRSEGDLREIGISDDISDSNRRITREPDNFAGKILDRLEPEYRIKLFGELPPPITVPILDLSAESNEDKFLVCLTSIPDETLKNTIFDVLCLLKSGDTHTAKSRIDLHFQDEGLPEYEKIGDLSEEDILNIEDGETVRAIRIGSPEYENWVNEYLRTEKELDWFLFMHPEQAKYISTDYSGPAKLSGVSGSGKTGIAVRRAARLVADAPDETCAIVTLNRSLAHLIQQLVDHVTPSDDVRDRIKVMSYFELCQSLLQELEPNNHRLYSDVTWKTEEHIDEVFREFYRCQLGYTKAEVLKPLHRTLASMGIDAEAYLREEFDWIRSAVSPFDRENYLAMSRSGRVYPIEESRRQLILDGLGYWEQKMKDVGVIDYLGLSTAVYRNIDKLDARFRFLIVDEVQDFGTTELKVLRRLVPNAENDIFLCGDLAQHILPKNQKFSESGIDISGRSSRIQRNYRNSREILRAAYNVLLANLDEAMLQGGDMELLDPEYASRSSAEPVVLKADSLADELRYALALMKDNSEIYRQQKGDRDHRGCIVVAGYSNYELSVFGREHEIPVLDGTKKLDSAKLFLSDLEQTKGYEFDTVAILNCNHDVLPPASLPQEESFRVGCQLYVAMTRAREQLVLSYNSIPSAWLSDKDSHMSMEAWKDHVNIGDADEIGTPGHIPQVPDSDDDTHAVMALTGDGFGYTMFARDLTPDILAKLEELVPGRAVRRGQHRVKWESVGQLHEDMRVGGTTGRTGHIFGPAADAIVFEALEAASIANPIVTRLTRTKPRDASSRRGSR